MFVFRIVMVYIVCRDSCSYLTVAGFEVSWKHCWIIKIMLKEKVVL